MKFPEPNPLVGNLIGNDFEMANAFPVLRKMVTVK
jgi:hypothetical protein